MTPTSAAEPAPNAFRAHGAHTRQLAAVDVATHRTQFRILGPLEIVRRGSVVGASGRKPRALLARLLLDANRTVSVDALVDSLWGDRPPSTALKMVQVYVSQLRKVLPSGLLRTRAPGYLLEVAPEAIDLLRFDRLRADGRAALADGDPATAAERMRAALLLWRGRALAEFSEPFAAVAAAHLEELRLAALEERIDADLALGHHRQVVGELQALVADHRLRERFRWQLMVALYRAGRHAEALAAYDGYRRALSDELGIEPSAALSELQYKILNQDASLDVEPPGDRPRRPRIAAAAPDGIVGRAGELERLERALGSAAAGRGSTALIAGPAGIGKTRLARELADRARSGGATVLTGRCIDLVGAGLPYLPLVEALRPLRGSPALEGLPELSRLIPGAGGPVPGADRRAGDSQLHLFDEVLAVLDRLSRAAPVVLVLEDMHWADGSTLDLLAYLSHAVPDRRVLIVASWRREATQSGDAVARLRRTGLVGVVELGPLPRNELQLLLARSAEAPVSAELIETVCARAEGNPFFAEELLGAALRGEDSLPHVLRDVLMTDLGRLGGASMAIVRVAAAAGRAVPHRLLTAAVSVPEPETLEALRHAVDHAVLIPDQAAGTYRFRHALIAEAAYATLLPGEREAVHERIARALGEMPASAGELAEHWIAAGRPVEALSASLQAARDAEAVSGLSEALRHLERVLELWEQVPHAEQVAGVAMDTVLAWATELAGDGVSRPAAIAMSEARELYPLAVMLESIAIRQSPRLGRAALAALRRANERMRAALHDPSAAIAADDEFHARLAAACGNPQLLAALRSVKQALLRYEQVYMLEPDRIERSTRQHDEIIEALDRGDHPEAAQRVRQNLTGGLPDLTPALER
jgi:DNA-binding SARP family transcriptional activator